MKKEMLPVEEIAQLLQIQLQQGGVGQLVVTGSSMKPMLHNKKDVVYLEPAPETLCKRDLIFYRRENGAYILHRIVACKGNGKYICCGDNQWEKENVSQEQIIARVFRFVRNGKTYSVTHKGYRLYVWLWVAVFPIRRPILAMRRILGKLRAWLRKNSKTGRK